MLQTVALSFLAGLAGTNALPHLVKGLVGEEFPNLLGNSPLRNALAGVAGVFLALLCAYGAGMPGHPWTAAVSALAGALPMAVFHGLRGAYRLNAAAGRPHPVAPWSQGAQGG